jgi:hypothetical protein
MADTLDGLTDAEYDAQRRAEWQAEQGHDLIDQVDEADEDDDFEEEEEDGAEQAPEPDGYCCDDCAVAIANDDYSGMDDKQEAATRKGLSEITSYVVIGDEVGFMHDRCDICDGLAGSRHSFFLPEIHQEVK